MATLTYTAGSYGNIVNGVSVAPSKNVAALVDLSTVVQGSLLCKILTGATAITAQTSFNAYRVSGAPASGNTTLSAGPSSGATSISVNSTTGIGKNTVIAVVAASTGIGELVTVSAVSGTTLTVGALINSYLTSDLVFLIEQTSTGGAVAPGIAWAANTEYSASIYPSAGSVYIVAAKNTDTGQPVTVTITLDKNASFQ
jgi:hypothetical protein